MRSYLTLDQHGHIHKHIVELPDRVFELNDVSVTRFDVRESLFCLLRLHDDLREAVRLIGFEQRSKRDRLLNRFSQRTNTRERDREKRIIKDVPLA